MLHTFLLVQLLLMMTYRGKAQKKRMQNYVKNQKEIILCICVCIHPNGSVRNGVKFQVFKNLRRVLQNQGEPCTSCTMCYYSDCVYVLRFEFSVGIERSQNLMLDQKLDQVLIPYLFLVLSINFA